MFLLKALFYLLTLLLNLGLVKTQIQVNFCNEGNIVGSAFWLCKSDDYIKKPQPPWPLTVKETVVVYDIPEFHENEKTISISMELTVFWNDTRMKINSIDPSDV